MNKWLSLNCFEKNLPQVCIQTSKLQINSRGPWWGGTMGTPVKLINPPSLSLFSGADPTPKHEASYEQWLFQARGALNSHTEEEV